MRFDIAVIDGMIENRADALTEPVCGLRLPRRRHAAHDINQIRPAKLIEPPTAEQRQHVFPDRLLHRALAVRVAQLRQVLRQPALGGLGEGDRGATAPQFGLPPCRPPLRFATELKESGFAAAGDEQVRPPALAVVRNRCHCRADSMRTFGPGMAFWPDAMGQAIAQLIDLSASVMFARQGGTELAERVGFECVATALIPQDYGAPCQASCRQRFRHGNSSTIERMRQGVVLRGLRGRPPPHPHECDFHSNSRVTGRESPQTPQDVVLMFKLNALRCGDRCLEAPQELRGTPRSAHREFAQGLRL